MVGIYGTRCPHCGTHNNFDVDETAIAAQCGRCDRRLFEGRSLAVSGEDFKLYAKAGSIPVLLLCIARRHHKSPFDTDLYATFHEPHLRVLTIEAFENDHVMARLGVNAVPTGLLLRDGKVVDKELGLPVPRGDDPYKRLLDRQGIPITPWRPTPRS